MNKSDLWDGFSLPEAGVVMECRPAKEWGLGSFTETWIQGKVVYSSRQTVVINFPCAGGADNELVVTKWDRKPGA